MQPLQICIGPNIRVGRESWCLPYAGFFLDQIIKYTTTELDVVALFVGYPSQSNWQMSLLWTNNAILKSFIIKNVL